MERKIMKTMISLMLLLLECVFLFSCTRKEKQETAVQEFVSISQDEAAKLMEEEKDCVILDVRRPDEFSEGHIPEAINIPNETIEEKAEEVLKDKDQLILVYCRSGNRSKQASRKLANMGYTQIREFGGIIDWKGKIEK